MPHPCAHAFVASILAVAFVGSAAGAVPPPGTPAERVDWDRVKREWRSLTPREQATYDAILAEWISRVAPGLSGAKTAGDACSEATYEISSLPFADVGDTTGKLDHVFLSFGGRCAGGGGQFGGTGFGPDVVYRLKVSVNCDLRITLEPEADVDLALYVVTDCAFPVSTCVIVNDLGGRGAAEQVTFSADSETTYFVFVDGYNLMAGTYALTVEEAGATGCSLVPVELQRFSVE